MKLAVNDICAASAEETVMEIQRRNGEGVAVPANVTWEDEVRALVAKVTEHYGTVNILINNAGVLRPTKIIDISEEEWDFVVDANLKAAFLCMNHTLPAILAHKW